MTISRAALFLCLSTLFGAPFASATVLNLTGVSVSGTEGSPFSGTIATFTDSRGGATVGDFLGQINWGDGTNAAGTFTSPGSFALSGSHTYAEEGSYTISFQVTDTVNNNASSNFTSATIADAPLSIVGFQNFLYTPGTAVSPTLVTFSDADPGGAVGDYSATINWGDATLSAGTIIASGGNFLVSGSHTYAVSGAYSVAVSVSDIGGSSTGQNVTGTATPEPSAIFLGAAGLGVLLAGRRRMRLRYAREYGSH